MYRVLAKEGSLFKVQCKCGKEALLTRQALISNQTGCRSCWAETQRTANEESLHKLAYQKHCQLADKRGLENKLDFPSWYGLVTSPCHYCGESDSNTVVHRNKHVQWKRNGVDRVDSKVGYLPQNCVPCCCHCNYAKRTQSPDEYILRCIKIAEKHQENLRCMGV